MSFKIYSSSFKSAGFSSLVVAQGLLLQNVKVLAVALGKGDHGLLVSNDEHVSFSSGEGLSVGVLQVNNVEATEVSLDVQNLGDSADVVSAGDVGEVSGFIAEPLEDLVVLEVESDGISLVDFGVGEPDGSSVVSDDVGDLVGSNCFASDLEEFGFGFSFFDLGQGEPAFDVEEESVVFVGFGDGDDVHESDGESGVSSGFIINSDASFLILKDDVGFAASEGDLEVVPACCWEYLRMMERGRHSLSLWGPWLGLVA